MISEVDHQIGRILDAVDEDTYIVFAGDNGLAVGQHGLMGKQNLYDHSWRVPLVVSGPGIPRDRRAGTLCHIMDLCPTIAEFAGVRMPPDIDGRTLRPALHGQDATVRESVVAPYREVQRAIRTDRWKLILYNVAARKTTQLFDLRRDPLEMTNLADRAEHAGRIAELKASLQRHLKAAGDRTDLDSPAWMGAKDL
jgi:arylsulfatase A-like enzyme